MVETDACTDDEKRAALERALASRTFARSDQLRSFLRFVCEAELRGETRALTEYLIGVEVLHRPAAYSPAEDSSVRTRAYELRHKLEKLYSSELADEPVQILIPKGSYSPQFIRTADASSASHEHFAQPAPPIEVPPEPPRRESAARRLYLLVAVALVAGLAGGALALALRSGIGAHLDPVIAEAWGPFAKPNSTVLLVPATPLYLVLGPESHGAFGTPIYPAPPEAYPLFRQHRPLAAGARLGMIFTNDALGVGSMNAVVIASETVRELGAVSQILPERAAMMSVLHGRDTILFGAPVDSQAIAEILEKTPLSVVYDESVKEFVVRDRQTGQTFFPEKEANGDFRSVYGLITVLNTRESNQGRLGMMVFSGITSVGTHGAAEYFTSSPSLAALRETFAKDGISGFPPAYQVVVKCRFENMLLVGVEYAAHRVLRREF